MKFYYFLLVLATSNTYASTSPANVPVSPTASASSHIPFAQVRFDATEPLPATSLYAITQQYKKQQQQAAAHTKKPTRKIKQQV